jgi:hypothetical protein
MLAGQLSHHQSSSRPAHVRKIHPDGRERGYAEVRGPGAIKAGQRYIGRHPAAGLLEPFHDAQGDAIARCTKSGARHAGGEHGLGHNLAILFHRTGCGKEQVSIGLNTFSPQGGLIGLVALHHIKMGQASTKANASMTMLYEMTDHCGDAVSAFGVYRGDAELRVECGDGDNRSA